MNKKIIAIGCVLAAAVYGFRAALSWMDDADLQMRQSGWGDY